MSKRLLGTGLFAVTLGVLFFALTVLLGGTSTHAQQNLSATSGAVAPKAAPGAVQGVWGDIAPFPTVSVSPTPGTYPLRLKRAGAAAYPPNGNLYVLGGRHGTDGEDVALQWIWEYQPANPPDSGPGTWTRKNALLDGSAPGSRYTANMAVAVLTDTNGPRIYAVGGSSINSEPTPAVRIYNPVSDSLDTTSADVWPATPARIPGGYAVLNNKLYIFGGFSALGSGGVFTDTWVFDPLAAHGSQWAQIPSANLPLGRAYIAGAALDGYIYAIGGDTWDQVNHTLLPQTNVERLNPLAPSPSWQSISSLPSARGDMGAWAYDTGSGYEISGKLVIGGGVYPVPDATAYEYDPLTNSWSVFAPLVHATRNYGAAQLDGFLYAFGGYDYSNNTPTGANFNQRYDASHPIGTPTNTPTGTPPTATSTRTPTSTATPTSTPCNNGCVTSTATATIVPGVTDTGISCDDCVGTVSLPFLFNFYDRSFTMINISSNGNLQFNSQDNEYSNVCLPYTGFDYAIIPYWDDLKTDTGTGCGAYTSGCGIFTSVTGSAPNRIFNIEWRAILYGAETPVNFEVRLYEGLGGFDMIYGTLSDPGNSATVGIQKGDGSSQYCQFECDSGGLSQGLEIHYEASTCAPPTSTVTPTPTRTPTFSATPTNSNTPTITPTYTPTSTPTGTPTVIPSSTETSVPTDTPTDTETATPVPPTETYSPTETAVSTATETQIAATETATPTGTPVPPTAIPTETSTSTQVPATETATPVVTSTPCTITFSDVHTTDYFYQPVLYLYCQHAISGYDDNTFRPYNFTTRGQLSKIVVLAEGWQIDTSGGPHFTDVPETNPFYSYIETAYHHQVISGYDDHTFRWGNNVTRGQLTKIVVVAQGWSIDTTGGPHFTDVPTTDPFYSWIETAVHHLIISGYADGTFHPAAYATRGQIAKIVYLAVTQ